MAPFWSLWFLLNFRVPRFSGAGGLSAAKPTTGLTLMGFANAQPILLLLARRNAMIRKLASGKYRLYSRKVDPKTGRRRNLGTFGSRAAAAKHERAVQFFKRH